MIFINHDNEQIEKKYNRIDPFDYNIKDEILLNIDDLNDIEISNERKQAVKKDCETRYQIIEYYIRTSYVNFKDLKRKNIWLKTKTPSKIADILIKKYDGNVLKITYASDFYKYKGEQIVLISDINFSNNDILIGLIKMLSGSNLFFFPLINGGQGNINPCFFNLIIISEKSIEEFFYKPEDIPYQNNFDYKDMDSNTKFKRIGSRLPTVSDKDRKEWESKDFQIGGK